MKTKQTRQDLKITQSQDNTIARQYNRKAIQSQDMAINKHGKTRKVQAQVHVKTKTTRSALHSPF
jgi:hypothetical protein